MGVAVSDTSNARTSDLSNSIVKSGPVGGVSEATHPE